MAHDVLGERRRYSGARALPFWLAGGYVVGTLALFAAHWAADAIDRNGAIPFPLLVWQVGWYYLSLPVVMFLERARFYGPDTGTLAGLGAPVALGAAQWFLMGVMITRIARRWRR